MDHAKLRKLALARTLCLTLLALAIGSCHRSNGPQENGFHPYAIRHATLHFEYEGTARGREEMYIDSFGILEAKWVHSEVQEKKDDKEGFRTTSVYTTKHRAQVTIVDSEKKMEIHIKDTRFDSLYRLDKDDVPSPEQVFSEYFTKLKYHVVCDTIVLGIHAKKWQQEEQPMFVVESGGIILGNQFGPAGLGFGLRLVSIDTVSPIDPSRFVAKSDYPIQNITSNGSPQGHPQ